MPVSSTLLSVVSSMPTSLTTPSLVSCNACCNHAYRGLVVTYFNCYVQCGVKYRECYLLRKQALRCCSCESATTSCLSPTDIVGDGACLFRAVCLIYYGRQQEHTNLRRMTINYMCAHEPYFSEFGPAEFGKSVSFSDYLHKISHPHKEVGEFVLNAIANVLEISVVVHFLTVLQGNILHSLAKTLTPLVSTWFFVTCFHLTAATIWHYCSIMPLIWTHNAL